MNDNDLQLMFDYWYEKMKQANINDFSKDLTVEVIPKYPYKSKKKRIRKKWIKNCNKKEIVFHNCYPTINVLNNEMNMKYDSYEIKENK